MMLNFYGLTLLNLKTGEIGRSQSWKERYENLNERSHNYLRICNSFHLLLFILSSNYYKFGTVGVLKVEKTSH